MAVRQITLVQQAFAPLTDSLEAGDAIDTPMEAANKSINALYVLLIHQGLVLYLHITFPSIVSIIQFPLLSPIDISKSTNHKQTKILNRAKSSITDRMKATATTVDIAITANSAKFSKYLNIWAFLKFFHLLSGIYL